MDQIIQISYLILAPLSVLSEGLLIYFFWRVNQFKDHPEIMIFWQSLSQIIFDIHWVTGVKSIKSSLSPFECCFLGALCIYFYFLSWDYNLCLSIEILLKILYPHQSDYKTRLIIYHLTSHLTSLIIFIILLTSKTNGDSVLSTCFVQSYTRHEIIVMIPSVIHFPLCIMIIGYTIYVSYNTYYANYLKFHMLVVLTFSITWVPVGLAHGIISINSKVKMPFWFVCLAAVLGALSGFLVCLARLMQKGLLRKIYLSICSPKDFDKSLTVKLKAQNLQSEVRMDSYSILFEKVTALVSFIQGVKKILLALLNVFTCLHRNADQPALSNRKSTRKWFFFLGTSESRETKTKVTQFHVILFERIMKKFRVRFEDIIKSFNENFEDLEERVTTSKGKSGAFFYFSADKEFILKSINKTELAVFNDLAKDYSDRICGDSGSFLTKFFGVFKVKFGKTPAFFLVLMENLTGNLGDPLLFDIKGSTKNRRASVEEFNDISEMPRNIVYKDLDFKVNVGSLVIPEEVYRKISEIVEKDAELLMNFKIMDYSLMVVVGSKKQLKVTLIDRFIINCHNQLITYIGIIDFLQCYNTRKKLENKYRTFNHDPKEPSCIPPKPYKSRFQEKVQSLFSFS